jgi:hypothetical protein
VSAISVLDEYFRKSTKRGKNFVIAKIGVNKDEKVRLLYVFLLLIYDV